jgi:hypothetical protein
MSLFLLTIEEGVTVTQFGHFDVSLAGLLLTYRGRIDLQSPLFEIFRSYVNSP